MRRGVHCAFCAGNGKVTAAEAAADMRAADAEPPVDYIGIAKPWKSRCLKCQSVIHPQLHSVRGRVGACKYCAYFGLASDAPTMVHVLHHPARAVVKVGITGIRVSATSYDRVAASPGTAGPSWTARTSSPEPPP
ncbi:hypothetical protein ACFVT2_36840 [Streptomyces sp. NPDC058000]|uniref:hypothetical protein n=1 Tax=Streptomyces sp. NPDC058000 TaxID=3346299 RepID=UPI0036F0E754